MDHERQGRNTRRTAPHRAHGRVDSFRTDPLPAAGAHSRSAECCVSSDRSTARIHPQEVRSMEITTERVKVRVGSLSMPAYVARPTAPGSYPAVIVFMEIFGVNHHIRSVTER